MVWLASNGLWRANHRNPMCGTIGIIGMEISCVAAANNNNKRKKKKERERGRER